MLKLSKLVGSTALAQLMGVMIIPIVTKLYGVELYGSFGEILSVSSILATILGLRLDLAILDSRNRSVKFELQFLGSSFALFIILLITISNFLYFSDVKIFYSSVIAFFVTLVVILNSVLNSESRYTYLSLNKFIQSVLPSIVMLGPLFLTSYLSVDYMVFSFVFSLGIIILVFIFNYYKKFYLPSRIVLSDVFSTNYRYPLYLVPSTLLSELSGNLPILMVSYYFAPEFSGYLFLGIKLISIPGVFIGTAIGEVFREEFGSLDDLNDRKRLFVTYFIYLLLLSTFSVLIFYSLSPYIVKFFFGDDWLISSDVIRAFSFLLFGQILSSPLSYTIVYKNFHGRDLILQLFRCVFSLLVIWFFWKEDFFIEGLMAYSVVYFLYYLAHSYIQFKSVLK